MDEHWGEIDWVEPDDEQSADINEPADFNDSEGKKQFIIGVAEILSSLALTKANRYAVDAHDVAAYVPAFFVMGGIAVDGFRRMYQGVGIEQTLNNLRDQLNKP
jgi:hypothetical protein